MYLSSYFLFLKFLDAENEEARGIRDSYIYNFNSD